MTAAKLLSPYRTGLLAGAALILLGATLAAHGAERPVVKIPNSQLVPIVWSAVDGWTEDDHQAAFATFLNSCRAILRGTPSARKGRPLFSALHHVCQRAVAAKPHNAQEARAFFEQNFRPVQISPLGDVDGFLTGYYEPIVEGTLQPNGEYSAPLYRKPPNLLKGGRMLKAASFAAKKHKGRKHRLVPFYDRAAIEDGVLAGRKLEICYLKDPIDSFFIHIQGSARVKLNDGRMLRVNYDAQNGHPYYAVGKYLIDRKYVTREEMSMDRIRQWMNANPEEGKELRRMNKSYVFFREIKLADNEEPVGAQGVSLTPGRSIAVDRSLHVYGTPFFISANLPIESEQPTTKFRRLMVAQDTGGAIVGPARADLYFGAGDEAASIAGRMKHPGRFVMLFPNEIDPAAKHVPLPRPRPAITEVVAEKSDNKPDAASVSTQPKEKKKRKAKAAASKPKG
jgi:membrane-bound lytic murein transglycosylase A